MIGKQLFKGQVFLKYLWQHNFYNIGEGSVSPMLSRDLKRIAINQNWIKPDKKLDNAIVFHWITDSVIPKWGRLSGFYLAVEHGWQPTDYIDVMSVIYLESNRLNKSELELNKILDYYRTKNELVFPQIVINKIISDNW